jgi:UDP-glucose 6-dehydrogenase
MLAQGDITNVASLAMQKETNSMRVSENALITKAMQESQKNISGFEV